MSNIYYYLIQVILHAEKAPISYRKYYETKEIKDYTVWVLDKSYGVGLAIILDRKLSHYPETLERALDLHQTMQYIESPIQMSQLINEVKRLVLNVLIKEVALQNITMENDKYFSVLIDSTDPAMLDMFIKVVEKTKLSA